MFQHFCILIVSFRTWRCMAFAMRHNLLQISEIYDKFKKDRAEKIFKLVMNKPISRYIVIHEHLE